MWNLGFLHFKHLVIRKMKFPVRKIIITGKLLVIFWNVICLPITLKYVNDCIQTFHVWLLHVHVMSYIIEVCRAVL